MSDSGSGSGTNGSMPDPDEEVTQQDDNPGREDPALLLVKAMGALNVRDRPESSNDIYYALWTDLFDSHAYEQLRKLPTSGVDVGIRATDDTFVRLDKISKLYLQAVSERKLVHGTPSDKFKSRIKERTEKNFFPYLAGIFPDLSNEEHYNLVINAIKKHRDTLEPKLSQNSQFATEEIYIPSGFNNPYAVPPTNEERLVSDGAPIAFVPLDMKLQVVDNETTEKKISTAQLVSIIVNESITKGKDSTPLTVIDEKIAAASKKPNGREKNLEIGTYKYLKAALPYFYYSRMADGLETARGQKEIRAKAEERAQAQKEVEAKHKDEEKFKLNPAHKLFSVQTDSLIQFGQRVEGFEVNGEAHLNSIPKDAPHLEFINDPAKDAEIAFKAAFSNEFIIKKMYEAKNSGTGDQEILNAAKQASIYFAERQFVRRSLSSREEDGYLVKIDGKNYIPNSIVMEPQQKAANVRATVSSICSFALNLEKQLAAGKFLGSGKYLPGLGARLVLQGVDADNKPAQETYTLGQNSLFGDDASRTRSMIWASWKPKLANFLVVPLITQIIKSSAIKDHPWGNNGQDPKKDGDKKSGGALKIAGAAILGAAILPFKWKPKGTFGKCTKWLVAMPVYYTQVIPPVAGFLLTSTAVAIGGVAAIGGAGYLVKKGLDAFKERKNKPSANNATTPAQVQVPSQAQGQAPAQAQGQAAPSQAQGQAPTQAQGQAPAQGQAATQQAPTKSSWKGISVAVAGVAASIGLLNWHFSSKAPKSEAEAGTSQVTVAASPITTVPAAQPSRTYAQRMAEAAQPPKARIVEDEVTPEQIIGAKVVNVSTYVAKFENTKVDFNKAIYKGKIEKELKGLEPSAIEKIGGKELLQKVQKIIPDFGKQKTGSIEKINLNQGSKISPEAIQAQLAASKSGVITIGSM